MKKIDIHNDKHLQKNIFDIPEGYFDGLTAAIEKRIANEQKPEEKLTIRSKGNVFQVPEGYFDKLTEAIEQNTTAKEQPKQGSVLRLNWRWWGMSAAASVVGLLFWFTLLDRQESLESEALNDIPSADIVSYLYEQGISQQELAENTSVQWSDSLLYDQTNIVNHLNLTEKDILEHLAEGELD
jgi:hypothetical protein